MDERGGCGRVEAMNRIHAFLLLVVVAAAGCAPTDEPPPASPAQPRPAAGPEETARRLVAEVLGIDADEVEIVSVAAREFSDSSLGCPQPGMSYLQVITPGYRVLLEADGRRFDVRTSGGQGRICRRRKPGDAETRPRGDTAAVSELAESARRQLAAQLDTQSSAVALLGIRDRRPGELLPGCDTECTTEKDCGYVVQLGFEQRRYTYLAKDDRFTACPAIETS